MGETKLPKIRINLPSAKLSSAEKRLAGTAKPRPEAKPQRMKCFVREDDENTVPHFPGATTFSVPEFYSNKPTTLLSPCGEFSVVVPANFDRTRPKIAVVVHRQGSNRNEWISCGPSIVPVEILNRFTNTRPHEIMPALTLSACSMEVSDGDTTQMIDSEKRIHERKRFIAASSAKFDSLYCGE